MDREEAITAMNAERVALKKEISEINIKAYSIEAIACVMFDLAIASSIYLGLPKERFLDELSKAYDQAKEIIDVKP